MKLENVFILDEYKAAQTTWRNIQNFIYRGLQNSMTHGSFSAFLQCQLAAHSTTNTWFNNHLGGQINKATIGNFKKKEQPEASASLIVQTPQVVPLFYGVTVINRF